MSRHIFKLPDLGEGTVSAEVIAWHVKPGDVVTEGQTLAEMSTEKTVVEVPAPVSGTVVSLTGTPGQSIAVGSELAVFELGGDATPAVQPVNAAAPAKAAATPVATVANATAAPAVVAKSAPPPTSSTHGVRASPSTRRRAQTLGVDLATVRPSGPGGRVLMTDLETASQQPSASAPTVGEVEEFPVIGVRRVIAQRMQEAKRNIPHFSYVEEVDVTRLEELRLELNKGQTRLTYLPFIVMAVIGAIREYPQCNALFDAERNVLRRFRPVHVGIATHTSDGLKVPVVRHADALDLRTLSTSIQQVTESARDRTASREQLSGSTITVTSLGALGGIASTPIINPPEMAIIGVNRAVLRPMVVDGAIVIRRMMNLSASFDHRFVDGHDAAAMIQAVRRRLEQPALLFIR